MFSSIVGPLTENLKRHHSLYESACNSLQWEELCAKSLKESGFGSDWLPDMNHRSSIDQTTDSGIKISNKSGIILRNNELQFSGSRLGSFSKLKDKLKHLLSSQTDYILFLSRKEKEWENMMKKYYFIIYKSSFFDYHLQTWNLDFYIKGKNKGTPKGWKCECDKYEAKIVESMSSQIWTKVKLEYLEKIYEINI
jgi:hypothetical protein